MQSHQKQNKVPDIAFPVGTQVRAKELEQETLEAILAEEHWEWERGFSLQSQALHSLQTMALPDSSRNRVTCQSSCLLATKHLTDIQFF